MKLRFEKNSILDGAGAPVFQVSPVTNLFSVIVAGIAGFVTFVASLFLFFALCESIRVVPANADRRAGPDSVVIMLSMIFAFSMTMFAVYVFRGPSTFRVKSKRDEFPSFRLTPTAWLGFRSNTYKVNDELGETVALLNSAPFRNFWTGRWTVCDRDGTPTIEISEQNSVPRIVRLIAGRLGAFAIVIGMLLLVVMVIPLFLDFGFTGIVAAGVAGSLLLKAFDLVKKIAGSTCTMTDPTTSESIGTIRSTLADKNLELVDETRSVFSLPVLAAIGVLVANL